MAYNEIDTSEQDETPQGESKNHSSNFLEKAATLAKGKKASATGTKKHHSAPHKKHHAKKVAAKK